MVVVYAVGGAVDVVAFAAVAAENNRSDGLLCGQVNWGRSW